MSNALPETINAAASPEVQSNDNFLALAALMTYGHAPTLDTSALIRGYSGGRWGGFAFADTAHTFGASTTTYVSVKRSDGTIDFSTSNTHYNDTTNYARVETVVTGTAAISSVTDDRAGPGGIHGGTAAGSYTPGQGVNAQTGTTYTYLNSDLDKLVTHSNASAIAATLPQAGSGGNFAATWFMDVENRGAGTLTITPTTSTIDGLSSFALATGQGMRIVSDGTNYFTERGVGGGTFTGGTMTSAINEAPAVTIASSTTPAIFAAAGNTINLTGTVTVTGFDTIAAGAVRRVIFGGALQLTYNATSMQNISAANITTAAGDVAEFESLGSGNTKMLSYQRKDGTALVGASARPASASPAFSATPTLDTSTGAVLYFGALTANVTAFNLTGTDPKTVVCFVQDGTGGRTVVAGTSIDFGGDIADLSSVASAAGAYTYVGFIYNPTTGKFRVVAISK